MPVGLSKPDPASLHPVAGVKLGTAVAGIRKKSRKDLLLVSLAEGSRVGAVFTRNRFCAAPVVVAKEHLLLGAPAALLVNTGCANAGTGADGIERAKRCCDIAARRLALRAEQVLPFSTGVIMEPLPVERIEAGLQDCVASLDESNWLDAAEAIMTTDSTPKARSRRVDIEGHTVTVTGIAKGSGMIRPDMATMLAFVATDASLADELLQGLVGYVASKSFNCVTVDGDTSTNDSLVVVATGRSLLPKIETSDSAAFAALLEAITGVCMELAHALVRDGEGATKFIEIAVEGGLNEGECRKVAYSIAHSPLVKTAFFASDPNLGRILAAVGYAGIGDLDVGGVSMYLDEVLVVAQGGRAADYREEDGQHVMQRDEITVRILLNRGTAVARIWTCDLSHQYVSINADYRS